METITIYYSNQITSVQMENINLCNVSRVEEDYDHFFMSCKYLDMFWNKINEVLKKVKFENNMRLQHLVFGYKILDKEYFHLNYFLTILAFTI
jgi:hypothetical protein